MRDVEEAGRLVEQQDVGLLRQRHRDPRPLPLAAGQFVHGSVREVGDLGGLKRGGDGLVVRSAPRSERTLVRVAAPTDEIRDGDALGREGILRQQPEDARDFFRLPAAQFQPVEHHRTRRRCEQPGERSQQSRLAASVGTDDRRDLARRDGVVERIDHDPVAVAERDTLCGELVGTSHSEPPERLILTSNTNRYGAPSTPVTTPTG